VAQHEKPQKTWLWVLDFNYQLTNLPNYQIVGENGTAPIKARKNSRHCLHHVSIPAQAGEKFDL
jgi:hypothetical protein